MNLVEEIQAFSPVVVFIDDGFAPASLELINADDWASLRSSDLSGWADLKKRCQLTLESPMELKRDEAELANLWKLYNEAPQEFSIFDPIFKKILADRQNAIRPLKEIILFFKDNANLVVCCHPDIDSADKDIRRSKLVFIDFYLYQQSTAQKAIDDAGSFSSLLSSKVEANDDQHNRFLFLISTNLPSGADIERFRMAAKVKAAFFMPVSKNSLNLNWIEKSLVKRVQRYNDLHHLASYLDTFSEQMEKVMDNLRVNLEALELHDLAILDHMRLKADGEDLGNYMSWLISEALATRIRASAPMLKASRDVSVVHRAPFHGMLSPNQILFSWFAEITFGLPGPDGGKVQFGDLYSCVTTADDNSDREAKVHFESKASGTDEGQGICACIVRAAKSVINAIRVPIDREPSDLPPEALGAVPQIEPEAPAAAQIDKDIVLVIAPACDLQRVKNDYEVLCVRGAIIKQTPSLVDLMEQRAVLGKDRTGMYKHLLRRVEDRKETFLLLEWYPDRITTILASDLQVSPYSRLARLNELFCQEIKEEALRQVGRIGVPVDPAFSIGLGATIVYRAEKNDPVHIEISDMETVSGVYTSGNGNNPAKIILSEEFIEKFSKKVDEIDPSLKVVSDKFIAARIEIIGKGGDGFVLSKGQCHIANKMFTIHYKSEFIRGSGDKGFCGVYFYPRGSIKDRPPDSA